ncbi:MAG: transglycosylase domain-containing protein, partial [Lachnospiraceae bacterium]|nr:transglycosylase domain-containing protein [Lachnospiraceae bacterium]
KKYSKDQILEFYMNNIYFMNGYYGIEAASQGYFSETVGDLSLSQVAFLCAIPNNPNYYDPLNHFKRTMKRRNRILKQMMEDKVISQKTYEKAKKEKIELKTTKYKKNNFAETYTYYCATRILMAQEGFEFRTDFEDEDDRNLYNAAYEEAYAAANSKLFTGGYRIYTSLDLALQKELQSAVDSGLAAFTETNEEGIYTLQSAAVCIDNVTGLVRAIVGGRSQDVSGYTLNRAYQSYRQPGSSIKPVLIYTPMLERGYTADTIVDDSEIEDGPSNADGYYEGQMTLRRAVEKSKNTVAYKLMDELTPEMGLTYLKAMNFSRLDENDNRLAIALGGFTNGVSPLEMAKAYATLENDGKYREPGCIVKITGADGNLIYQADQTEEVIYKTNAARAMTDILEGVITEGTGKGLGISEMVSAGKTGTTNDNKDGWFVGYTRYYTTSVWVGYDRPKKLPGLTGASYPGSIWHAFMEKAHEELTPLAFLGPTEIMDTNEYEDTEEQLLEDAGEMPPEAEAEPVEEEPVEEVPEDIWELD